MKIKNIFRAAAGAVLSLLGFSGCDLIGHIVAPVCEYGMPHADYKVVGEVKDQDGNPIKDLQVKYRHFMGTYTDEQGQEQENWLEQDLTTDENGKVNSSVNDWETDMRNIEIHLVDVDGEANGLYDTKVLKDDDLSISKKEDPNSSWHVGTYTISFSASLNNKLAGE